MTHLPPMNEMQFKQEILPKVIEIMLQNGYTQTSEYKFEKSGNIVITSPDNMGYDSQGNLIFFDGEGRGRNII